MKESKMFKIHCTVSGGRTGTRQAYLKENGVEYETNDFEAAQAKVRNLRELVSPHSTATFTYTVELA
jgi:hypothetical protein